MIRVMLTLLDKLGQPVGPELPATMQVTGQLGNADQLRWQLATRATWEHVTTPVRAVAVRELPEQPDTTGRRWLVPFAVATHPNGGRITLTRLDDLLLPGLPGDPDDMTAPNPFADTDDDGTSAREAPTTPEPARRCTCVTSGPSMDGPDELCPEHGRTPDDWFDMVAGLRAVSAELASELRAAREALRVAVSPTDAPRWRIGRTYPEHVYAGDTPIATFVGDRDTAAANARTAVLSHNRQIPGIPDGEWVVIPPMGWANRLDELLGRYGIDKRTPMDPSNPDDGPRLGAALVELIREWGVQG